MPVRWSSLFREIPWTGVVNAALSAAEGAKGAWSRMQDRLRPAPPSTTPGSLPAPGPEERVAALEVRLQKLEKKNEELAQEAVASFEVVRSLTEQHSRVAGAVDALIERNRVLLRVCAGLAAAIVALALYVVFR